MRSVRRYLVLSMLFTGLVLVGYFATFALAGQVTMLFRNAPGMALVTTIGQWSALATAACLFIGMALIATAASLMPGGWGRKLVLTLPAFFLAVLLIGAVMSVLGIGAGVFVTSWLAMSGGLALAATVVAVLRLDLSYVTLRRAMSAMAIGAIPVALVCLALGAGMVIVSTNQPETPTAGGQGAASSPNAPTTPGGAAGAGRPAEQAAPGGQPGGQPGGGRRPDPAAAVSSFRLGAGLTLVLGLATLLSAARGWRALRDPDVLATAALPTASSAAAAPGELGRAIASGLILAAVTLLVIQVVPVTRDNPPVETAIAWDSQRTEELAQRACMDCHSNATTWPWYAYVAPASWLTALHVHEGREGLNFSAINQYPPDRRDDLPGGIKRRVENGRMPLPDYLLLHPVARLTEAEQAELIEGIEASLAKTP